jgi:acyl-CoA synthetase (AMP-forming)/AMP-acid ligase II
MSVAPSRNVFLGAILEHFVRKGTEVFCHTISNNASHAITWSGLESSCRAFGTAYRRAGLQPGDVVLIFGRHGQGLYGAFFGAMLNGFVPSFMPPTSPKQNPQLYWSSHAELLQHIKPTLIVADDAVFDEMAKAGLKLEGIRCLSFDEVSEEGMADFNLPPPDAIALLQHSSGTTGLKKGVALSFTAIIAQVVSYGKAIDLTASDVIVSWLPLYHDMGLMACLVMPIFFGVKLVHIDPFHWLSRPATLFKAIAQHKGTFVWLPNFSYDHLALVLQRQAAQFDLSSVRAFINCSEPCKTRSFDRFAKTFAAAGVRVEQLQCCYAMAETVFAITQTPLGVPPRRVRVDPEHLKTGMFAVDPAGSLELLEVGPAISGIQVRVYDDARNELEDGQVGEFGVSGEVLFSGYYLDAVRTAAQLKDEVFFTRDQGFVYEGRVYVLGRKDDLIIINGRNFYAHEIEALVSRIDGVKPGRAVAISLFDDRVGSSVLLLIAERNKNSDRQNQHIEEEIMSSINSVFGITPRTTRLVEEGWLIKTTSGKISRKENLVRHLAEFTVEVP